VPKDSAVVLNESAVVRNYLEVVLNGSRAVKMGISVILNDFFVVSVKKVLEVHK